MAKTKDQPWQYAFTTILSAVTLLLIFGYFIQSFIEIRKVKPVTVAMERIGKLRENPVSEPGEVSEGQEEPVGVSVGVE